MAAQDSNMKGTAASYDDTLKTQSEKDLVNHDDKEPSYAYVQFKKVYDYFNDLMNTYVFTDESKDSEEFPIFSKAQRWNIFMYILGIMCYKFALEQYNGTIRALALDRFTSEGLPVYTYQGYLDGFNAAAQCVGAIIVGPLMNLFPLKNVLFGALFSIAILSSIIMCVEQANGGTFPTKCVANDGLPPKCSGAIAGDWNPVGIIPIFVFSGIPYGSIELVRRIIPQQIVGGVEMKLKKMDALVHIYYEVAGTTGAFFAAYVSVILGKAFAPVLSPPLFMISAFLFYQIIPAQSRVSMRENTTGCGEFMWVFTKAMWYAFYGFGEAVYQGGRIIIFEQRFTWLFFGYTIPLVMHRYIENGVASVFAKLVLGESAYGSFMVAGSNFGELCGALFIFTFLKLIATPLPPVRWDAIVLNATWLYGNVVTPDKVSCSVGGTAAIMAGVMWFVSSGWAAGDVSMAAFIQCTIPKIQTPGIEIAKALPSVMAFLYVSYIVIYAVMSPMIGRWVDDFTERSNEAKAAGNKVLAAQIKQDQIDEYFFWMAGVMFSIVSVVIFVATYTPKGSWKCNPTLDDTVEMRTPEEGEEGYVPTAEVDPTDVSVVDKGNKYESVEA